MKKVLTRILTSLFLAAVILPAYLINGGVYLYWVLYFCLAVSLFEFVTVICLSNRLSLRLGDHIEPTIVFVELLISMIWLSSLPVKLLGGCILISICTDAAAYLVGSLIGGKLIKRRPFPKASPKKSFEGLIAGLIVGFAVACCWMNVLKDTDVTIPLFRLLIIPPLSVLGDLIESRFKRLYDVKDANDFLVKNPVFKWIEMPLGGRDGHGGYLDRIDSLILVLCIQLFIL